jgi:hypothetical protein
MRFAKPGDPLVVGMSAVIPATERGPADFSLTVPTLANLQPKIRRSSKELPAERQTQTVINALIVYKIAGMSVNEMAVVLGTDIEQIEHVLSLPAFQETFEIVFKELLSANSSSLQARISAYAGRSVENVMELANYKPTPKTVKDEETGDETEQEGDWKVPPIVVLKANQDILDRSGLSPDTLFGKGNQDDGNTLQIEVIAEQDNRTQVNIKVGK